VHVGLILPGFIATEGFPAEELTSKFVTRWMVSDVSKAAEAVYEAGVLGKPERYVPRPYGLIAVLKILAPGLVRRILSGGTAKMMTTKTGADAAEQEKART
jgi:short-subunit dehydrogenase